MKTKLGAGAFAKVYLEAGSAVKTYSQDDKFEASKEIEFLQLIKKNRSEFKKKYGCSKSSIITLKKWKYCSESKTTKLFFKPYECSLQDVIGSLSEDDSKEIFHRIMLGLAELQFSGIIHGDLKPENILVNTDPLAVKIIDFNKSVLAASPIKPLDIQTLYYTPPEIILGCRDYNYSVDIWTAVCILYEMLNGKHMFNLFHKDSCIDSFSSADSASSANSVDSASSAGSDDSDGSYEYEKFKFRHLAMLHMYSSMLGEVPIPDSAEFADDYFSNGKLIGLFGEPSRKIFNEKLDFIDTIFERTMHYNYNNRLSIDEYLSIHARKH